MRPRLRFCLHYLPLLSLVELPLLEAHVQNVLTTEAAIRVIRQSEDLLVDGLLFGYGEEIEKKVS